MDAEKIRQLLDKQLNGSLSIEERDDLLAYVNLHEQEALNLMVSQIGKEAEHPVNVEPDTIRSLFQIAVKTDQKSRRRRLRRSRTTWTIMAVLLLAVGALGYVYMNRTAQPTPFIAGNSKDLPPGRSGAMLTLSDGSVIQLDDAKNGQLAKQGSTVVAKNNGVLTYGAGDNNGGNVFNTMSTPRGRQFQLLLPDGSKVWLNAASSVRYPVAFNGNERIVELNGEAYFEIAKNTAKPFVVKLIDNKITVLGTSFNVMAYNNEDTWRTTLIEGALKVEQQQQQVILKPGEQVLTRSGFDVDHAADIETEVAWKNGNFFFNETTTIQSVMRQVCDWYDVEVVFHGNINKHVGGRVSREVTLLQMLKFLEETGVVKCKLEDRTIHIYPS